MNSTELNRSRLVWDGLIRRRGTIALLRKPNSFDRPVAICNAHFTAIERMGNVSNPNDRKILMSVFDPTTGQLLNPEPSEQDMLVAGNENLKLVAPPGRVGDDSQNPLYWTLQVRA